MRGGSNMPRVGDYNRVLIVELVRRNPGISRVELSERTGLTGQTVSNICTYLCDQGLIEETGRMTTGGGRWRTVYRVVATSRFAVGLHIDPARTVVALVDLAGNVIDRTSIETPSGERPDMAIDAIADAVRDVVARNDVAPGSLAGVGVAAPGPISKGPGTVVGPPNLRGWDVVRLRDDLTARLGVPVELEKDTVAAVTGELWAGEAPSDDFLFVYLGTGAGGGVVLGGEVMHGAAGNLGNFGHLGGDPDGPRCSCGARGCISITAMPADLVDQAVAAGILDRPSRTDAAAVERALADLAGLARGGSDQATAILDGAAAGFGRVAANLVNVLDLDAVVFGGPNWPSLRDSFMRVVPGVVEEQHLFRTMHGVSVGASSLGEDVGPIGAASLVLANAVSARPEMLFASV